jgi:hypothetical protein
MSYGEMRLGQGREHVRNFLRENPTLCVEIEKSVRAKAAIKAADAMPKPRGVAGTPPSTNGSAPAPAEAEDAPVEA